MRTLPNEGLTRALQIQMHAWIQQYQQGAKALAFTPNSYSWQAEEAASGMLSARALPSASRT